MSKIDLREALADELATIRAINGALANPLTVHSTREALETGRETCLAVVQKLLNQLHPNSHPAPRRKSNRKVVSK